MKQILAALKFLHENQIVAMENGNILPICDTTDEWFQIRLFMGNCNSLETQITFYPWDTALNPILTSAADMLAIGDLTHMMLFGDVIYAELHPMRRLVELSKTGVAFNDPHNEVSDDAKDFMRKLLVMDTKQRMTLTEAMTHAWITNPQPANIELKTSLKEWKVRHQRMLDRT
eukprot:TRINITY_DN11062_c0_g1_i1.p1 TRINITY_DN11062_c0_g1~~TRINITY_DN11062_c0_g1_i1.p1  ORF type:complete len:173 (+),score=5.43 TRINITY_DN11062_c0_g1_i1:170-688(+)